VIVNSSTPADLTIVIINWNTRALLADCLASLPTATRGLQVRTVVVDNASHDGSAQMVRSRFPGVDVLDSGGNVGFSRGNNLALRAAQSPAVLLLNPDTVCPPDSLSRLYRVLETRPRAAAVGPVLTLDDGRPTASFGDFPGLEIHVWNLLDPAHRWRPLRLRGHGLGRIPADEPATEPFAVDYLKGACLMLRRSVLEKIGLLDEQFFMYFEETDWCRRAHEASHEILLCPDCRITHLEGQAAARVSDFCLAQFQRSYRLYLAKHHGPKVVGRFRLAQFGEYLVKGLIRCLAPWSAHSRNLASSYLRTARLQLSNEIDVQPPE